MLETIPVGEAVISRLTTVETTSALVRRSRAGDFSGEELTTALRLFEDDVTRHFRVVELGGAAMLRANLLIHRHALRASDAIQLACALMARGAPPAGGDFTLVSSDRELNDAARAEKMDVLDPTLSS